MTSNGIKGTLKDAEGAIQRKWGEVTNDPTQIAEGSAKQALGKGQKAVGKVQSGL